MCLCMLAYVDIEKGQKIHQPVAKDEEHEGILIFYFVYITCLYKQNCII